MPTREQMQELADRATEITPRVVESIKGERGMVAVAALINAIRHAANAQTSREGQLGLLRMVQAEMDFSIKEVEGGATVEQAVAESENRTKH